MNEVPLIENASTAASLTRPEVQITPMPQIAAELGVTAAALATTIRIATLGDSGANVAKFNAGERQIPIIVRLAESVRRDMSRMAGTRIPTNTGVAVPIGVVATLALGSGPSSIDAMTSNTSRPCKRIWRRVHFLAPHLQLRFRCPSPLPCRRGRRFRGPVTSR